MTTKILARLGESGVKHADGLPQANGMPTRETNFLKATSTPHKLLCVKNHKDGQASRRVESAWCPESTQGLL
jgi:hypothetical protein